MTGPATHGADGDRLRRDGQRVEALLEELRAMTTAPTYQRVEELVQRVVRLYGAALERLLGIALAEPSDPHELAHRICDDELVAGLLLIHGIHPEPPMVRIRAAIEPLWDQVGQRVELVGIDESNTARLQISDARTGDARANVTGLIERVVLDAAPELDGVVVSGTSPEPSPEPDLIQIDIGRSRRSG